MQKVTDKENSSHYIKHLLKMQQKYYHDSKQSINATLASKGLVGSKSFVDYRPKPTPHTT